MPFSILLEYQNTFKYNELFVFITCLNENDNVVVNYEDPQGFGKLSQEMVDSIGATSEVVGYYYNYILNFSGNDFSQKLASGYFKANSGNETATFNIKMAFFDNGRNQDYNKGATFNGKIVIKDELSVNEVEEVNEITDSWEEIATNVRNGDISKYHVGDTKEVEIDGTSYTVRVANNTTPSECSGNDFSQTACGLVFEFVDIVEERQMNSTSTNVGGWPASSMQTYANEDFFNKLPSDLQNVIVDTKVISGHGSTSGEANFTSTDKIYLLSSHEVYTDGTSNAISSRDSAYNNTRQLDYYVSKGVTTSNYTNVIKQNNGSNAVWWLRSAPSSSSTSFLIVTLNGNWFGTGAYISYGFAPAFRIG